MGSKGASGGPAQGTLCDEAYLDPLIQRRGNAPQHGDRMAVIIGVLKAANSRGGRSHKFGECSLRKTGPGAQARDLAGNVRIGALFLQGGQPVGAAGVVTFVNDRQGITG